MSYQDHAHPRALRREREVLAQVAAPNTMDHDAAPSGRRRETEVRASAVPIASPPRVSSARARRLAAFVISHTDSLLDANPFLPRPPDPKEERRIRKERQKAKEKARLGGGKGSKEAKPSAKKPSSSGPPENLLKRRTTFLCPMEFKNDLPPVPVDWKFLRVPVDHESFTKYSHLALDDELRADVALSADLGITLDPLLMKQFQVPAERPSLDPADLALLEDGETARPRTGIVTDTSKKKLKVKRPDLSKALWLMNTQYISSQALPEHLGRSEKAYAKELRGDDAGDASWRDPREVQVEAIEASFAAARKTPVHDKRPDDVRAVEVIPVLPDFERWSGSYLRFVYDEDPARDVASVADLDDAGKAAALERAIVKPYSLPSADGGKEKFVALMLPKDPSAAAMEGEAEPYEWIREYQYRIVEERDRAAGLGNMCFFFDEKEGTARYVELNTKLALSKRSKHAKVTRDAEWRPSEITVKRVAPDDDETKRRVRLRMTLEDPEQAAALAAEEAAATVAEEAAAAAETVEAGAAAE